MLRTESKLKNHPIHSVETEAEMPSERLTATSQVISHAEIFQRTVEPRSLYKYIYIYTHIYIHTHIYIYIHIYISQALLVAYSI